MAKSVIKSGLAAALGDAGRKAVEAHKNDDVRYSQAGDLPAGLNGIAQLVECKFDKYKEGANKGKYYFYAAGVVINPKEHNGIPVEGLRTSIMEPMCQTTKGDGTIVSIDEHVDRVLNEYRKLGIDTDGMTLDDLEPTAIALKDSKPTFRFRTWSGKPTAQYPEPRVNHDWRGICEYQIDEEDAVADNTDDDATDAAPTDDADTEENSAVDDQNWTELGEAADNGDEEAMTAINGKAEELGIDPDAKDKKKNPLYPTWSSVAEAIVEAEGGEAADDSDEEPEAEEAADEYTPEKEDMVMYKAPGKKNAAECEVTAVFEKSQLVNLKSADGKVYKSIAWDKISPVTA